MLLAAVIVAGAGAALAWRLAGVRAEVAAALPPRPPIEGLSLQFPDRLDQAEARARSLWGSRAGLAELARLYHANGFLPHASDCERALMRLEPTNPRWPYLLAHTIGGYGDLDEALPLLQRTVELAPDYGPARVRLGDAFLKRNEPERAATIYRQVLSDEPANGYATIGLARTEIAADRAAAARDRLQRLVSDQPLFAPAWTLLISVDEQLGDTALAERHRIESRATGRSRDMTDPWIDELMEDCYDPYRLAVAASTADPANDQARARELLQRAISVAPQGDLAHRLLGNLLSDLGELPAARGYLERATELNPRDPDNWSYLLRVQKAMNDMPAAVRTLEAGLAHCPDAPVLHLERGRRLVAAGELDRAAEAFERSRRLRPEESSAYVELAVVRFKQDRLEEGIAELREAVKVDPTQPVAIVLLARYAINTGDPAAAKDWIQRSRLQPKVRPADLDSLIAEYRSAFGHDPF